MTESRGRSEAASKPAEIEVAGERLLADPAGVLVSEAHSLLIVADLHFEKGSSFAARGVFLPPWDTAATLARLAETLARWRPRCVVALGDSFHDGRAGERLSYDDLGLLQRLQAGRQWIWVAGNHDPSPPRGIGGEVAAEVEIGPLVLRHEPRPGAASGEIAGHLHPVARVVTRRGSARRRCFVGDGERCVMPAFGAYAGGLNFLNPAYDALFQGSRRTAHVLGRDRVFPVSERSCAIE
jgi:uncharacterized protein